MLHFVCTGVKSMCRSEFSNASGQLFNGCCTLSAPVLTGCLESNFKPMQKNLHCFYTKNLMSASSVNQKRIKDFVYCLNTHISRLTSCCENKSMCRSEFSNASGQLFNGCFNLSAPVLNLCAGVNFQMLPDNYLMDAALCLHRY